MGQLAGSVIQLVIEPALVHLSFVALVEQAAHRFELLDGRCISPLLEHEVGKAEMLAAAVPSAKGSSVHEKELSADFGAGLLLLVNRGCKQFYAAGTFAVERVEVEQDCRHDFGHDVGIDHKGRH